MKPEYQRSDYASSHNFRTTLLSPQALSNYYQSGIDSMET